MTESDDRAELLKRKNMYADICCELKETICRLSEERDALSPSDIVSGRGNDVIEALRNAERMRRDTMDLMEEIDGEL